MVEREQLARRTAAELPHLVYEQAGIVSQIGRGNPRRIAVRWGELEYWFDEDQVYRGQGPMMF